MFDDVLSIFVRARLLRLDSAAFLVLGDANDVWVAQQAPRDITPWADTRLLFGLPAHTQANPVLVRRVIAERGAEFNTLSLFAWIEDQFVYEPRAEIFGVTPFGEEPFLFLRDLDLDRPPQVCAENEPGATHPLLLLAGVLWVDANVAHGVHTVAPDEAALTGVSLTLPEQLRAFADVLRAEAATADLKAVLRRMRKQLNPDLAHFLDGWRVLSRAVPLGELGWLFTPAGMVLAQVIIGAPIVTAWVANALRDARDLHGPQLRALGASRAQLVRALLRESREPILMAVLAAFARLISEVGAVMLVGGNIDGQTRTLTTAILVETRMGNFEVALLMGAMLLALSFCAHLVLLRADRRPVLLQAAP
jgi:hypothetical protein